MSVPHDIDSAVARLAETWSRLAGEQLAKDVATGRCCDRCARRALFTIGRAGGIAPGDLGRLTAGYAQAMHRIADRIAERLDLDSEEGAA